MQRHQVHGDQDQQHQRYRDHVKGKEAVQGHVRDRVVATDPCSQVVADDGHGREQVDNHLRPPIRHLAPRKQVAEERFGHQREVDKAADDPQELAWPAIAAVKERPKHMQIDDDEKSRRAGRVRIADEPPAGDVAHDVFDRLESPGRIGLVAHGQKNAGEDLHHQHHQRQRAEEIPEVEILRRVILRDLRFPQRGQRETVVDPVQNFLHRCARLTPS